MSVLSASKWMILALPFAARNCNGSGGGGGKNPSPSSDTWDWLSIKAASLVPQGVADALHQLPVIGWLI